ncbi:MAG: hypothetical protein JOZ62_05795 [Acidobacteriaceae bacterium]|nr:hypothetical protein [Acidobacteriaceae bacterium]
MKLPNELVDLQIGFVFEFRVAEAARGALAGAREVLLQGSFYEVSLALVGVASLAYFQY